MSNIKSREQREQLLGELMALRAQYAIGHGLDGFKMDLEEALQLLKNTEDANLTKSDIEKRDRLAAMVDNLIEFSVCAEYQMFKEILKHNPDIYETGVDFYDEEAMEEYYEICNKYNDQYAAVENGDIVYAMGIAYSWLLCSPTTYLTYMTQNDDRVRPWHYALQGFTARRDDFPSWMIPPIEWGCRCFLMSESGEIIAKSDAIKHVKASFDVPEKPSELDDIFSESVAKCGRIFGKSHPYFKVAKADRDRLKQYVEEIRRTYYG